MLSQSKNNLHKWAVGIYFLQLLFFYFLLFTFYRVVFILRLVYYFPQLSFIKASASFFYAIHLDVAMFCYLAVLPLLFFFLYSILQKKVFLKIAKYCTNTIAVFYSMVATGDILLYKAWKTKLNMQAVLHFKQPAEVFKTASWVDIILFFVAMPLVIIVFNKLYNSICTQKNSPLKNVRVNTIAFLPALIFILIFFRGGLQELPISESKAYFSNINEYNDASVNPLFSFINNASAYFLHSNENPFVCMPIEDAKKEVHTFYKNTQLENIENCLTTPKPNIIVIILESFSAQCSSYFGGANYAPNIDSIAKSGLAFTHCYSTGNVSDQGIPGILSAFPASPSASLINQTSKSKTLPCIVNEIKPLGYNTGFLYGGQLSFGNIKSYIMQQQFDIVKDENDLPIHYTKQALGINDMDMGSVLQNELNKVSEPFFYGWFTLSTHNDFDIPVPKTNMATIENEYVNALHYTDSSLGVFFTNAKKQKWYKNTLFVLVSDHSHNTPANTDFTNIDRYRIPLIFVGDVLQPAYKDKKIDYTVSQLDITATLLQQLGLQENASKFSWSKNLFTHQKHFAPYCYFNGAGFILDSNFCLYNLQNKNTPEATNLLPNDTSFKHTTQAFIQAIYEDYRSR